MVMVKIQLFQKFQKFADGGPRRKTEKFWQIEKIIIDLYELDNSKKKIFFKKNFQNRDSKCHFSTDFEQNGKYFLIDRANLTRFSGTRSLSDQNCMLKNF